MFDSSNELYPLDNRCNPQIVATKNGRYLQVSLLETTINPSICNINVSDFYAFLQFYLCSFIQISLKVKVKSLSHVQLFLTPWTVNLLGSSMGFSGQENWSELTFPSPEDLPDPGIEPRSPAL